MPKYLEVRCRRALSRSGLPDLDYALNPYLGCEHGCIYCYARLYTPPQIAREWGEIVAIRRNIVEVLRREVRFLKRGTVGVGTISDGYQPIEEREELTRRCIEVLLGAGFRVSVQTKSSLVERDADLLKNPLADVGLTITFVDDAKARAYEPRASPPSERIETARSLRKRGVEVWIFYGPVIPGANDDWETFREILSLAKELRARLYIDPLHPKRFMFETGVLAKEARETRSKRFRDRIEAMFRACAEEGVKCLPGFEGDASQEGASRASYTLDRFLGSS